MAAVFSLGFAFGAEADVIAFIVARQFGVGVYSPVMGLLTAAISISASLGAVSLSYIFSQTSGFDIFLLVTGISVLAGASLLLLLQRADPNGKSTAAAAAIDPVAVPTASKSVVPDTMAL